MSSKTVANEILFADVIRLINEGRDVKLTVKGNSMRPFILHGDSVELSPITSLEVGDIVLAQRTPKNFLVHRVIAISGDFITLRGDGNTNFTEEVMRHDIIAQATMIEHKKDGRQVDPRTPKQRRRAAIWQKLFPIRRYLLFFGRHLCGWNHL